MNGYTIRKSQPTDVGDIYSLYKNVAADNNGLARNDTEIDVAYVQGFTKKSQESGLQLVAVQDDGRIIGEMHGYSLLPAVFIHILSEVTIAIDSTCQGQGIGRAILSAFLQEVVQNRPDIYRVELIARASNVRAIRLYEQLGFHKEGRFEHRIKTTNGFEADIPMAWFNPQAIFSKE
ncbi:MAG: GNAT family N-acetyltransferase [Chitinophagales bacterium]|nr:GNAT family N-acetyltransferase [Chitinophagales bacterium]